LQGAGIFRGRERAHFVPVAGALGRIPAHRDAQTKSSFDLITGAMTLRGEGASPSS
jgi:hypothetical protein